MSGSSYTSMLVFAIIYFRVLTAVVINENHCEINKIQSLSNCRYNCSMIEASTHLIWRRTDVQEE